MSLGEMVTIVTLHTSLKIANIYEVQSCEYAKHKQSQSIYPWKYFFSFNSRRLLDSINAIFLLFFSLLQLPMIQGQGNSNSSNCVDASTLGYANPSSCTLMEIQNGPLQTYEKSCVPRTTTALTAGPSRS